MKTIKTLGLALLTVVALGAVSAEAASAHQWLVEGATLNGSKAILVKGAMEFHVTQSTYQFNPTFECKYDEEGTISPEGKGEITKVTNTSGGTKIECEVYSSSEAGYKKVVLAPEHLPWKTRLATYGTKEVQLVFNEVVTKWSETAAAWSITSESIFSKEERNRCVLPNEILKKNVVEHSVEASVAHAETGCSGTMWKDIANTGVEGIKAASGETLGFE
jgi:hypothetical protein